MKTRQIAHNDYLSAKYRSCAQYTTNLVIWKIRRCIVGRETQMVSQNHTVANDGTDNDDVDGYASEINRQMRTIFFRELDIYARPRRRTSRFAACNEIPRIIRGKLVGRVGLNWIMTCVGCDAFSRVRSELPLYARKFINDICESQRNNLNKIIELFGIAIFQSKQRIITIYSIFHRL